MAGKVCLVTGASSGIGRATAAGLAERGATVLMHGHDQQRSVRALAEVRARACYGGSATLFTADLSSMAEVRRLSEEVLVGSQRLDVLVNNAGVMPFQRRITVDGYEYGFALNHLAPFLLTALLLEQLTASAPARVVTVSSATHRRARLDLDDLHGERSFSAMAAYGGSKLANVLFTYELARRMEGSGVTANCLHPGAVATRLFRGRPGVLGRLIRLAGTLARPLLRNPRRGAETVIYLAASPEVQDVSGRYFEDCAEQPSSAASHDIGTARRLWEVSERLTGLAS
jgi:NAD(P)-dependent dehydrogenase (short-subunit alcohol dehydrogenase family)